MGNESGHATERDQLADILGACAGFLTVFGIAIAIAEFDIVEQLQAEGLLDMNTNTGVAISLGTVIGTLTAGYCVMSLVGNKISPGYWNRIVNTPTARD
jgi:hypothetical protein